MPAFRWFKLFVVVICYFHRRKNILSRNKGNIFFGSSESALSNFRKQKSPKISDEMVEGQCVQKLWGHQLYNNIVKKRSSNQFFDTLCLFVKNYFL